MSRFTLFTVPQLTQGADGKWAPDESKPPRLRCRRLGDIADLGVDGQLRTMPPGEYTGTLVMTKGSMVDAATSTKRNFLIYNLVSAAVPVTDAPGAADGHDDEFPFG